MSEPSRIENRHPYPEACYLGHSKATQTGQTLQSKFAQGNFEPHLVSTSYIHKVRLNCYRTIFVQFKPEYYVMYRPGLPD